MELGQIIKKKRKELDMSVADLAKKANVSRAYIFQLESGESKKPSAETLYNLAVALDTTIAELLGKQIKSVDRDVKIPETLEKAAIQYKIPEEDKEMLARIKHRGRNPSEDDWHFLYQCIKRWQQRR